VEFEEKDAFFKALTLDGAEFNGAQLIVNAAARTSVVGGGLGSVLSAGDFLGWSLNY
jgi:hypothetical protein